MAKCETCGNEYDKAFQVTKGGQTHTYDSFECAIHALAPTCSACGTRIIGHGLERNGTFFCCDHCAESCHHAITQRRSLLRSIYLLIKWL